MRFLLLGDASSYHTHRWAESIAGEGHDVHIVSLEPPIRGNVVPFRPPPVGKFKYVASVPGIRKLARGLEPDVIFAHFLPNYGLIGTFLGARVKVLALWGSDILHWAFKTPLHRVLAGRILRGYDLIVVDANFVVEVLKRNFNVPPERVRVIPFGVPKEVRDLGLRDLPEEPLHFVSMRRHEPLFNHTEILKFLSMLKNDYPIRVTYLQSGSLSREIERYASDMGLDVRFTGRIGYSEYLEVLRATHFCISVPDRDTSSVSLLECMALGGVPIVSDIPANREWVDEERGILTPPDADEMYARFKERFNFRWWKRAREANRSLILQRCNWEENLRRFLSTVESYL